MHRSVKLSLLVVLASLLVAGVGFAATDNDVQVVTLDIDEVAEITAGADITLTIVGTGTPGMQPVDPTSSATHLQYTSIVDASTRKVLVKLAAPDTVPAGTSLHVTASAPFASGAGASTGSVELTTSDQELITGIGSVATGDLEDDGPQLDYVWEIEDMTLLDFGNDDVATVTFTLTAEGV